jgi:putative transposase
MPCRVRDETYIKVKGKWTYYYRAVDNKGQTLDFMLSERRNKAAARRFFKRAIGSNGVPDRVVIDKSGANLAGLENVNVILKFTGSGNTIKILQVKYLNNIIERDHCFIKRITRPMLGFKAFHSADAVCEARSISVTTERPPSIVKKVCDRTSLMARRTSRLRQ